MFIAYEVSLDLIRSLRDGARNTAGHQRVRFDSAHGSASEVKAALAVAVSWGWIEAPTPSLETLDRLLALLWRLTHGRRSR